MPSLNKFLSSTTATARINDENEDYCKLPLKIDTTNYDKNKFQFGADQVRILLFRECEWRGRKLLFDSVTVGRNNNGSNINDDSCGKRTESSNSCPRNGNGLPQENEKKPYDNVSLLSEIIFGTVAMTYRGSLFKVHTFDSPRCIMCTKVFPASDHKLHKQRYSDDILGTSVNLDSDSSNGSIRNTLPTSSSGNLSGDSLRKSSTCSSTCVGWDIDIPLLGSSQSLESNSSSGFGSLSSLRRRWLRAMSTSLSHSEFDDLFGFQPYGENLGDMCDISTRRHKTRLGLAVLIKLLPGQERQMEIRLLEHSAQLEAMMNRLCYACFEPTRGKISGEYSGLIRRMHQASFKCTLRLFRLLVSSENTSVPSIWHEILLNTTTCMEKRLNTLYRSFQQMCHLLSTIDTKSTNFFLSTVVTAVLTYHLGWVNTVMSPRDQAWVENMKKKCPCNPLWAQLSDLYGTLGNPAKFVHTVISGDEDKVQLINAILSFLSYFIRSSIVERHNEKRDAPENDVQEAISIIQQKKSKNGSIIINSPNKWGSAFCSNVNNCELSSATRSNTILHNSSSQSSKQIELKCRRGNLTDGNDNKSPVNLNIPRLRKTNSLHMNLENHNFDTLTCETKLPLRFESKEDNLTSDSESGNYFDKDSTSNSVKIIVSQITTEAFGSEKLFTVTSGLDDFEHKHRLREQELSSVPPKLSFLHSPPDNSFNADKLHINGVRNTEVYFSHDEYTGIKQNPVLFTLGDEDKSIVAVANWSKQSLVSNANCNCSFAFTRVPSTSAQLPEGVLRKIIQRNFPESSKSIQRPPDTSLSRERSTGFCPKCNGSGNNYEAGDKLLLETPTNATEVLRTCASSVSTRGGRSHRIDTLEELLEANEVVELPMPTSKSIAEVSKEFKDISGFNDTLIQRTTTQLINSDINSFNDSNFTSGLVIQGITKKRGKRKNDKNDSDNCNNDDNDQSRDVHSNENLIAELREEVTINAHFPIVDQPISEALCILADVDDWQVGVISNNMLSQSPLLSVGMSRLVSDMLEAFVYLWTKYHSPAHCLNILECKLREMWLRSEALAEMLMTSDVCNISLTSLTNALDLDAADIPLLLAVATVHSPQIAQRIGLTLT